MITSKLLLKSLNNMQEVIAENKEYLTELDAKIGDADHGINMNKGFKAVKAKLEDAGEDSCDKILKTVAMTLISTVGGASGPLYGTAFLKAAGVVEGDSISDENLVEAFSAAIGGVQLRGKAEQGEKTMLDALIPAYNTFKEAIENGYALEDALEKSVEAAADGVEYTKTIVASKGRASYLGERTLGHQDPGATSSYLLLKALYETVSED
jgi:dihydroxyacetone kinase-like protein